MDYKRLVFAIHMFYRYLFCLGFSSTQFIALERNVKLCSSSLMYCTNKVNLLLKYLYCAINQMFDYFQSYQTA